MHKAASSTRQAYKGLEKLCIACRETHIPREVLQEYIEEMRRVFTPEQYDLFRNNCNHFSDDLATFLTGSGIPVHATDLLLASSTHMSICSAALFC